MSVSNNFQEFCYNLKMDVETTTKIQDRYRTITKRINKDYWSSESEYTHSLYVGSYGRDTEIFTSDIDMIVQLPYDIYVKYNAYTNNGQSALLQDVKTVIQKTYSTSYIKGDGQVVGINFRDNIDFEIVPVFENKDGSYTYPDTNNGGSWKITDPKKEIKAINNRNNEVNKNMKRLCKMTRAWKDTCNVPINGILIDTLAYNFLKDYKYRDKSYVYYDLLCRDFFKYLMDIDENTNYWLAPGSNRKVTSIGNFRKKAKEAYNISLIAIEYDVKGYNYLTIGKWREIYGTKFPY